MENSIRNEIIFCENKANEYYKDFEKNTNDNAEYWKGKAHAYRYLAIRLKRVLEWHEKCPTNK